MSHRVSARRAQQVVREWHKRPDRPELPDDQERLNDEIEVLDRAIEEYAELAVTSENDAVKLGAMNAKIRAQDRRIALYRATGVLPYELCRIKNRIDIAKWSDIVDEAFHRLEMEIPNTVVPADIMGRFVALIRELSDDPETKRAREAEQREQKALEKKKRARQFQAQGRDMQRRRYAEVYHVDGQKPSTG